MLVLLRKPFLKLLVFRIERHHHPNIVINEIRLIKFRSEAENPRTEFRRSEFIITGSRGDFRLSVLSSDDQHDLAKLSPSRFINDTIDTRVKRLLPRLQFERSRCERSLGVETMRFYPLDNLVRLLLIKEKALFLESLDYILINKLDPAPDGIFPVLDTLIV